MRWTTLLAILLAITPALAQGSQQQRSLYDKSSLSWNAFKCSVIARELGDPVEEKRLFLLGYEAGKAFLVGKEAGNVSNEAVSGAMLKFLVYTLDWSPSHDFTLGRIYEENFREISSSVSTDSEARIEFSRRNCGMIR